MDGMEIVVGTYEEFLLGYKLDNTGPEMQMVQSFATHAHTGSVRSTASAGRYLASGGADDKIVVHDMKSRTESRVLMHHEGTVTAVAFAEGGAHLISGSADGALTITRTGNWQMEKQWKMAHKGLAITYIAVHPSNKLLLTIGDDHTLRTWNLVKGRPAYAINLSSKNASQALTVEWGPEGQHFALTGYPEVTVWAVSNAAVKQMLKCPSKSLCMVWITESIAAVGLESGEVVMFDLDSGKSSIHTAHTQRVKCIAYDSGFLFTASSSGHIKVWKLKIKKMTISEKCSVSTGCRITCITLVKPNEPYIKKEVEAEENGEEEIDDTIKKGVKRKDSDSDKYDRVTQFDDVKRRYMPYVSVTLDEPEVKKPVFKPKKKKKPKKKTMVKKQ